MFNFVKIYFKAGKINCFFVKRHQQNTRFIFKKNILKTF